MAVDPDSPANGSFAPFTWQWKEDTLHLRPWAPLRERTTYALVATRGMKPADGACYRASNDMVAAAKTYVAGHGAKAATSDEAVFGVLFDKGVDPSDILSISVFTTQSATNALDGARRVMDKLADESAPEWDNFDIVSVEFDPVDQYAFATVNTPIFQNAQGRWQFGDDGLPIVDHWEELEVLVSLPSDPALQPYPLVEYGQVPGNGYGRGGFRAGGRGRGVPRSARSDAGTAPHGAAVLFRLLPSAALPRQPARDHRE
jgi:hypothetical protein